MTDYSELVKALRCCATMTCKGDECKYMILGCHDCWQKLHDDAAAAIEALQAAQPHWVSVEHPPKGDGAFAACCVYDGKIYWFKAIYLDGKWLREMDGLELPVNYWLEIPQPPQEVQE